jgi:hypothetical protein
MNIIGSDTNLHGNILPPSVRDILERLPIVRHGAAVLQKTCLAGAG